MIKSISMRLLVCIIGLATVVCSGTAFGADVYGISAIEKITPQQVYKTSWPTGSITLQSARNEWEAFQVVVRNPEAIEGISIKLGDLYGPKRTLLPAKLARLYKVEWVDVNTPFEVDKTSDSPDMRPDPLVPIKPGDSFTLESSKNLVFWIALQVPESAKPGNYSGTVNIYNKDRLIKSLPVILQVRSFALPRKPMLQSMIGFSDANIYRAHGCKTAEEKEKIIRLYFDEYIRARLSPFLYAPGTMAFNPLPDSAIRWEFIKGTDGKPTGEVILDFTNFDREGKRYFNDRKAFSAFNFAPYLWTRNNDKVVPLISDTKGTVVVSQKTDGTNDPVFEQVVIGVFRGIAAHLAKKSWLDRAIYYVTDEPGDDDMQSIKDICMLIRKADPRIRTSLTYDPANRPKLAELVDQNGKSLISVWVPYCTMYKQEVADDQRRKGADYWLYDVSTTNLIGMSAQTNRSIMWDIWRRGCHGYLYYLSTYWGQDFTPWDRPSFLLPGVSYRYKQGDGYFFYPPQHKYDPEKPIMDHVVPTIRWEMLREGAEDYDYLAMLQDLTLRAEKRKLKAAAEGESAMKLARTMSETMSGLMDGCNIRDLVFKPTDGWTFGLEEGWMQCSGGKRIDLPISFKTSLPDGRYRLVFSAYSDQSYRDLPYSKFLVNGKQYASPVGFTGPSNVVTEVVTVKNHKCDFVLSSVAEKYGVIIYQVGLQQAALGERSSLYTVRAKVADAIEHLQTSLKGRK